MSDTRTIAWGVLTTAARNWARDDSRETRQELHDAALAWAREQRPRETTGERAATGDGWTFRFGRNSGKRPDQVSLDDLRWYERVFRESLDNPEKERFRDNNQKALDVVRVELRRRGEAGNHE